MDDLPYVKRHKIDDYRFVKLLIFFLLVYYIEQLTVYCQ